MKHDENFFSGLVFRASCFMPLLTVLKYPNKKLKEKSKELKQLSSSVEQLTTSMLETMHSEHGVGLAAPQVGELIRVIVVDVPIIDPINPEKYTSNPLIMINPVVNQSRGMAQFEEGCLSCPELAVKVDRQTHVKVTYLDLEGKPHMLEATGLKAICIQHEIDHLNGILLVDRLNLMEKDAYKNQRVRVLKDEKERPLL